jgi:hypothetical protein
MDEPPRPSLMAFFDRPTRSTRPEPHRSKQGGVTATEPDIEPTSAWRWRKSRCRSRGRLGALRMTGVRHLNHDRFDHRQVGFTGIYVSIGT